MSDVEFCDTKSCCMPMTARRHRRNENGAKPTHGVVGGSPRISQYQVLHEFYVNVVRVTHDSIRAGRCPAISPVAHHDRGTAGPPPRDGTSRAISTIVLGCPDSHRGATSLSIGAMDGGLERRTADGRRRHTESVYADGVKWSE